MGNCQAVDNASFVLQTQNGRAERFYSPISAAQIMNLHPGYYVALLLTTTFYSSDNHHHQHPNNNLPTNTTKPLRVTRIKLLRPTDNLLLGHAYRLITTQEVMKGLKAKKNGNLNNNNNIKSFQLPESAGISEANSDCESAPSRSDQLGKTHIQMRKSDKHRPRTAVPTKSAPAGSKQRGWHPSLNSISEATS